MEAEPIDPRLEAAILAEPDSIEPRRVLADFLEGHGHSRAAWIRLTLATKPGRDYNVSDEMQVYLDRHDKFLCGIPTQGFALQWFAGFVYSVLIYRSRGALLDEVRRVMARHPSYRFVRKLTALRPDFEFDPAQPLPETLRVVALANSPTAVASLVPLPAFRRLQTVVFTSIGEETAQALLRASHPALELRTAKETITPATRTALARAFPKWQGPQYARMHATIEPRYAPASFAAEPPIRALHAGDAVDREWVGSGVSLWEHPIHAHDGVWCYECESTNTLVVWARSEISKHHSMWGRSRIDQYELQCRDCGKFSHYSCAA